MNTRIHALARRVSVKTLPARLALYCVLRRVSSPVMAHRLSFAGWVHS